MARIKATCSKCQRTILLFFDNESEDWTAISQLEQGEMFEHKCPHCEQWSAFEVVGSEQTRSRGMFRTAKAET